MMGRKTTTTQMSVCPQAETLMMVKWTPSETTGGYINLYCSKEVWEEKAMAPHSSTLAWKIPWAEEPGRLQSMGSRRVGHD